MADLLALAVVLCLIVPDFRPALPLFFLLLLFLFPNVVFAAAIALLALAFFCRD